MDSKTFVKLSEINNIIPDRIKDSHKGTYGKVCLLGGSTNFSGAIRLAGLSYCALRAGAGLCTVACPRHIVDIVSKNILETIIFPISNSLNASNDNYEIAFNENEIIDLMLKNEVIVCGMGLGRSDGATKIVEYLVKNYNGKLVLDADALNIVSENINILKYKKSEIMFTPHLQEFKRLNDAFLCEKIPLEGVKNNADDYAINFAKNFNLVLLLKGSITIITNGIITKYVDRGTPGMATAGSGDVLSGIIGGLSGYINNSFDVAVASAFINGLAGELASKKYGEISMVARDTVEFIHSAIKTIKNDRRARKSS